MEAVTEIWSDGSYDHMTRRGGVGYKWNRETTHHAGKCAYYPVFSSFQIEALAMAKGLLSSLSNPDNWREKEVRIYTDSRSLLLNL